MGAINCFRASVRGFGICALQERSTEKNQDFKSIGFKKNRPLNITVKILNSLKILNKSFKYKQLYITLFF